MKDRNCYRLEMYDPAVGESIVLFSTDKNRLLDEVRKQAEETQSRPTFNLYEMRTGPTIAYEGDFKWFVVSEIKTMVPIDG